MFDYDVVKMREELHKMPELGFEEVKTAAYVAERLTELGYEVTTGLGGTGVMGVIKGTEPGPVLMLRADMDALPFKNADGSIERIHACGHDGHTAMLLATAKELVGKVRRGTLKLLFQPAEETLRGADEVIKTGCCDDVEIALAAHVRPIQDCTPGHLCAGIMHQSSTFVQIDIQGRATHASRPHLGVNAAEAAALVTLAVSAIKMDPNKKWSCKVTSIYTPSSAANIIPDQATLKLDVRMQTDEMMTEALEKIKVAAKGAAESIGATAEVSLPGPIMLAAVYDEELKAEVAESITRLFGADHLDPDCGAGGEDFHFYRNCKKHPKVAYFGVGAGCAPGLHARDMHFDPEYLRNGVKVMVDMALKKVG
ncbi:MAG: amidohydrolase [Sutterellaceae bacterium]|nr:amidohydrolase [Sutterellaceae bacterium]